MGFEPRIENHCLHATELQFKGIILIYGAPDQIPPVYFIYSHMLRCHLKKAAQFFYFSVHFCALSLSRFSCRDSPICDGDYPIKEATVLYILL